MADRTMAVSVVAADRDSAIAAATAMVDQLLAPEGLPQEGLAVHVDLPASLAQLRPSAFRAMRSLCRLTIPAQLTEVCNGACGGCWWLRTVDLSHASSLTRIGNGAFFSCSTLQAITLPSTVTTIGEGAFENCTGLTVLSFPPKIRDIGQGAFRCCTAVTRVVFVEDTDTCGGGGTARQLLEQQTLRLGPYVFDGCVSLEAIDVPRVLLEIPCMAFARCTSLATARVGGMAMLVVGFAAFIECAALESVTLPGTVQTIGDRAFHGCDSLDTVTFMAAGSTAREEICIRPDAFPAAKGLPPVSLQWIPRSTLVVVRVPPCTCACVAVRLCCTFHAAGGTCACGSTLRGVPCTTSDVIRPILLEAPFLSWDYSGGLQWWATV